MRLAGALLVGCSAAALFGRGLVVLFVVATLVWLFGLKRPATPRLVFLVAVLVRVPFLFADYFSNDLYRYVWEGKVQLRGFSPYEHAPADPALAQLRDEDWPRVNHPEYTTIYPPLAQACFLAVAGAGLEEPGMRALAVALDVLVVLVLLAWLRATGRPPGRAVVYAWCPLAIVSAGTGHIDPLMLLCLAGTGWAWETGRARTAAALLGAAILAKTMAVLLVAWLLLRRPRAAWALVLVVVAGSLPYASPHMLDTLFAFGADFSFNASLFRVAERLDPDAAHAIVLALLALWVGLVALTQPRYATAAALSFAGLLLLAPTVHFWYLTWFLVALPAAGLRRWTWPLLAWTATAALASETYRAHYVDGAPFVERFPLTAVEYGIPLAVALWALTRGWPRRGSLAAARDVPPPDRFAVVIPCRGEAENLRSLLPAWLATGAERIVVADTPTGDGTQELARGERIAYVPVERRGYGAAVLAGLDAVDDPAFVVVCDADHALGPSQVGALLAPFEDPDVGLVTAARADARLSWPQRAGNALATLLIGLGWGRRFHDLGPFRALRRPFPTLVDTGTGINVEMNVRALERGLRVVEVPLPASERAFGENTISRTWRGVARAGYGILHRLFVLREQACARSS